MAENEMDGDQRLVRILIISIAFFLVFLVSAITTYSISNRIREHEKVKKLIDKGYEQVQVVQSYEHVWQKKEGAGE